MVGRLRMPAGDRLSLLVGKVDPLAERTADTSNCSPVQLAWLRCRESAGVRWQQHNCTINCVTSLKRGHTFISQRTANFTYLHFAPPSCRDWAHCVGIAWQACVRAGIRKAS